jgi:hypothetical protein
MLAHALNVNSESFVLSDFMALGGSFVDRNQQVLNFFIIDFHHGHIDLVFLVFIWVLGNPGENLFAGDGNNTLSGNKGTLLAP